MSDDDDLTIEEIADGLALWEEHMPRTSEDWLRVAERWQDLDPPDNPAPMFGALFDAVKQREELRKALRNVVDDFVAYAGERDAMDSGYVRQALDLLDRGA